jgi:murein DD-endopeptidase MepM/ murein hydrolase activator NlpD
MKRRHQRRTTLALLASVGFLGGLFPLAAATPAAAATSKIAGYGKVVTTGGTKLNMRTGAASSYAKVGEIANGGNVGIMCHVLGEAVTGSLRYSGLWDQLTNGAWVADAYVAHSGFRIPVCGPTTRSAPSPAWMLPVSAGLVSGFRTSTRPAHDGVDLGAARFTPIRSAAAGTVIRVVCNASTNNCNVDGSRSISGCGWYVEVLHAGGIVTRYCHMVRRPSVTVGQRVAKGTVLGNVGSSGASSGPHLHFEVHTGQPATRANAVSPIAFMRARGYVIR